MEFEGEEVTSVRIQLKSPQVEWEMLEMDSEVLVTFRGVVTEVVHKANQKTGEMLRRQVITADEIMRVDEVG